MKKTRIMAGGLAAAVALSLGLSACSNGGSSGGSDQPADKTLKLWVVGTDTPPDLRDYLKTTFEKENSGWTLQIEEQVWDGLVAKLTTAMSSESATPDVAELGNTQSPTFTYDGYFADISDMYNDLGGDDLLPAFIDAGKVDDKLYTVPYYWGSRYVFYRKDIWQQAGVSAPPTTLAQFNTDVAKVTTANPRNINNFSGFYLGGSDWRDGISWIFANGGNLAKKDGDKWVSTLSDPNSIKGIQQFQEIQNKASNAPADATDETPWLYINDSDTKLDADNKPIPGGETTLQAGSVMGPNWAHWSMGDPVKGDDGKITRQWNDKNFGVFALPGNDGKPAPVFAGGSNIGISAKTDSMTQAKSLMKIIFSPEYQEMLGKAGLGPGNTKYNSSLGDDEFAKASIDAASNAKLTPAAPGWSTVENDKIMEEFFSKVAQGGNVEQLAKEYDQRIDKVINGDS